MQIEPIQLEWDMFHPTLEKDFPEILNQVLCCNSQQQPPHSNKNISTPMENREQSSGRIDDTTRILTTLIHSTTHPNMATRCQYMSHSTPETANTYSRSCHFTNCKIQVTQDRRHTYHTTPFRPSDTVCKKQGFHHRGSSRLSN